MGCWQAWQNVSVSGVNLSAGSHELRIVFDTKQININYLADARIGHPLTAAGQPERSRGVGLARVSRALREGNYHPARPR